MRAELATIARMTRPTLLLVEDDDDLARMITIMLRKNTEVVHARNGQEALAVIQRGPLPTAIITDRAMPRMDGLQFVKQLKQDPLFKRIPVMMLTAMGDTRSTVEGINAGVKHYVAKPFRSGDLIEKVEKLLANSPIGPAEFASAAKAFKAFKAPTPDAPHPIAQEEISAEALAVLEEQLDAMDLDMVAFEEIEVDIE